MGTSESRDAQKKGLNYNFFFEKFRFLKLWPGIQNLVRKKVERFGFLLGLVNFETHGKKFK